MKHIQLVIPILLGAVGANWAQPNQPTTPQTTIPAGTHMLTQLVSPLNTVSATDGSAVYLDITMPVIVDNHVVIPAHTHVTGTVARERRPGRIKGRAQMRINFTNLIFSDYRVVSIDGALQGLPESHRDRRIDADGTIEPVDQIDRDIKAVAVPTLPGTVIGLLGGGNSGLRLALLGGGLGLGKTMVSRGDEISLPAGTPVEMVLKRDLHLDPVEALQKQHSPEPQEPATAQSRISRNQL
ncbi:MAG TPA: hypothetical protein VIW67_21425 [Terriglobales bacterium]